MKKLLRKTIFYKYYKKLIALYAVIVNGNPSKDMFVVGVTGTDGKTTTCNLLHAIINQNLGKCALITTINIKFGDEDIFNKSKMTSLNPIDLQVILRQAKEKLCKYVVLEVSSHGIDQYRFYGIDFDMGILTNITKEHIDYHETFENYVKTKKKLFQSIMRNPKDIKYAVLPKDCENGRKWAEDFMFDKYLDYGISLKAALKADNVKEEIDGTEFRLLYLANNIIVKIPLLGKFNVYNALACIAAGMLMGIRLEDSIKIIEKFPSLPGRMERIENEGITYFIDFAHTPNALESVLTFLQKIKGEGRIITVFGAPGLRDPYKRPLMGSVVEKNSDYVILTDDDPDKENRYNIINEVVKGIKRKEGENFYIIPEREYAIKMAIQIAKKGDIVLLAGKGHEKIQITNFGKRDWNDKDKLKLFLGIS